MQSSHWHLDSYGVLNQLLFNERIPDSPEGIFRLIGFVHLYSASGIHLIAMTNAIDSLGKIVARFFGFKPNRAKAICFYFSLFLLIYVWKLQAFRLGFVRPIFIFLIRHWAKSRGVKFKILYPLGVTLILDFVLGIGGGRLHYYLAVGGALIALEFISDGNSVKGKKTKEKNAFHEHFAMAIGSWIPIAIYDLWTHHLFAPLTPLLSLITLPVISFWLFPLTLLSVFFLKTIPDVLVQMWDSFLNGSIFFADSIPTVWIIAERNLQFSFLLAIVSMFFLFCFKQLKCSASLMVSLFLMLSFLCFAIRIQKPHFMQVQQIVQFDVRQGDSLLIQKGNHVEMIDTGSAHALKVSDFLLKLFFYGVTKIDTVLLTHLDEDHCGQLHKIMNWIPIRSVETNEQLWKSEKGVKLINTLIQNQSSAWPNLMICNQGCVKTALVKWFLHNQAGGNDLMAGVVIPLSADKAYFALGDGDQVQEKKYSEAFSEEIKLYQEKIWKVGHHGSKNSSSEAFLGQLKPRRAWVSVGKRNPYHHPHAFTLLRYEHFKIPIYRTDVDGDLVEKISQPDFSRIN